MEKYFLIFTMFLVSQLTLELFAEQVQTESNNQCSTYRNYLAEKGFEFGLLNKFELWHIPPKEQAQNTVFFINNLVTEFKFDFDKMVGLDGSSMHLDVLWIDSQRPNDIIGSAQGISNIEGQNNLLIFQCYLEQSLFDDKFSIRFGLLDLNSECDVKETSSLFLTPSHGIGTDFSQSGANGPSIFPVTSLAFRALYNFSDKFSFRYGIFDGIPGDTANRKGTRIILKESDGLLSVGEFKYSFDDSENKKFNKTLKIAAWYYTKETYNLISNINQFGFYGIAQFPLFKTVNKENDIIGLTSALRIGYADYKTHPTDIYVGLSFLYKGLVPGRINDYVGTALALSRVSNTFKNEQIQLGNSVKNYDANIEFFYRLELTSYLNIQLDFQYIINPLFNTNQDHWLIGGLRTTIDL